MSAPKQNVYQALAEKVFFDGFEVGKTEVPFTRESLIEAAAHLELSLPKNIGDVVYSIRYRIAMPERVAATAPEGMEWTIEGTGRAKYSFCLRRFNRITPNHQLLTIKIPDATPEIVAGYALSDEQALLAKVRYNRLVDIFLSITTYSLQNHLRTTVATIGQIEIDEIYVGLDDDGVQYVIPVQAKGGTDQLSVVQTKQDIACCEEKFPGLRCRAISTQFLDDNTIVMFELVVDSHGDLKVAKEKHYQLVPYDEAKSFP